MPHRRPPLLLATAFALFIVHSYATAASAAALTATMRAQDERLEHHVTVSASRIYLGELLERLSAQSDVPLVCDSEVMGAADERVSVFVNDVALGDVLEGLYSLLSYRNAEWHWRRTGVPGKFRYAFLPTRSAQFLGGDLDHKIQADFEAQAARVVQALKLPADGLQKFADAEPSAAPFLKEDYSRLGLTAFADALPPDVQLAVLRGQSSVTIPVSQLPPSGQEFLKSINKRVVGYQRLPDGTLGPLPDPTYVRFQLTTLGRSIAPTLGIEVENRITYSYLGGRTFAAPFLDDLQRLWNLPGDNPKRGAPATKIRDIPEDPDAVVEFGRLDRRLNQVSIGTPVSLLARIGPRANDDPGAPAGRTLDEYLGTLRSDPMHLQCKWRSGLLLISDPGWFKGRGQSKPVPYTVIKELRQAESRQDGYLSLKDLAFAASRLDELQLRSIRDEFPVLANVAYWRSLFDLYGRSERTAAQLASPGGLRFAGSPDLRNALSPARFDALESRSSAPPTAVRIVLESTASTTPPSRRITIQLLSGDSAVVKRAAFSNPKRASANICFNGGFEEVADETKATGPRDWALIGGSDGPAGFLSDNARLGKHSGRLATADSNLVGMNWLCKGVASGVVSFWYQAPKSTVEGANLCVYVIPMQELQGKQSEVVGPNGASARIAFRIPSSQIGDRQWHRATIPFDFRPMHAQHAILGPRINEFTPKLGGGELLLDDVEIIASRSAKR